MMFLFNTKILKINLNIWITIILFIQQINAEIIYRVDPLALLSATLRTYQRVACDTDQMSLSCPRGTSISIEIAQYGRNDGSDGITIEDLCPSDPHAPKFTQKDNSALITNEDLSSFNSGLNNINRYNNNHINNTNRNHNNNNISNGTSNAGITTIGNNNNNNNNNNNSSNIEITNINNTGIGTGIGSSSSSSSRMSNTNSNTPENCIWPNALQYSLLQTVVEACQKKKHCKFNASPGTYSGSGINSGVGEDSSGLSNSFHSATSLSADPCPRVRKFVEIAYKCRPYEFRSKVACENDVIQLECNPYSRIVIYSSSFGRTEYESIQCPQPQGVKEETCLASYATETVMQICHGRRRCNLSADSTTFGSPCNPNSRMYLKVVYTCVPKQVLKDRYESITEPDELENFEGDTNDLYDEDQFYKESEAIPKLQSNVSHTNTINSTIIEVQSSTTFNPLIIQSKGTNLQDEQERLYFYLLITGTIGIILCIIIVIIRAIIIHKRHQNDINQTSSNTSPKCETTIPNGFNDSISEIDADIDLTTSIPIPSVSKNENYITYGPSSSLYGSLGPTNVSHTSSTVLLPANPLMCTRQSPDIIGVSNTFIRQPPPPPSLPQTVASSHIGGTGNPIGAIQVPINPLTQYTTAPPYRVGYVISPEDVLRRPPISQQESQQLQNPGILIPSIHPSIRLQQPHQQLMKQQSSVDTGIMESTLDPPQYDGTAPRTLSTGVAQNSDFYYG